MERTDQELMKAYKTGDAAGFDELLRRYKVPLFIYIFKMLGNRAEAEDIFQETFMRVIKNSAKYDEKRPFSSWVFRIAHNLSVDVLRARKIHAIPTADLPEPREQTSQDPERAAFSSQARGAIQQALDRLPLEQRQVFIMREYSGMSFKEIAEATASPLNTVLGRMHLAVGKLRQFLAEFAEV